MPYTVSVDHEHQLIEVVYSGQITISTRVCAMEDGAVLLESHCYSRVLVDLREAVTAAEPLNLGNSFATRMAQTPRVRDSRMAYLMLPHQHSNRLIEIMASARHLSLDHFTDRAAALAWLLGDAPPTGLYV